MADWLKLPFSWHNLNWSLCGIVEVRRDRGCFMPCCRGSIRHVTPVELLRRAQFRALS